MNTELQRRHDFDMVYDTQAVFRKLLHALSNPGCEVNVLAEAEKFHIESPVLPAIAVTLLDNRTAFYGDGTDNAFIREFTLATESAPEEADFAFLSNKLTADEMDELFAKIKNGTFESPEFSCTLFVSCGEDEAPVAIWGPGVPGTRDAAIGSYAAEWLAARERAGILYPCGVEIFFVRESGGVIAVPRLCKMAPTGASSQPEEVQSL